MTIHLLKTPQTNFDSCSKQMTFGNPDSTPMFEAALNGSVRPSDWLEEVGNDQSKGNCRKVLSSLDFIRRRRSEAPVAGNLMRADCILNSGVKFTGRELL